MTEPSEHYVNVNGLTVHYTEMGSGEPILLIHGFPTSSHLWRNVMPILADTHRVIAIDLPGYGLSDKPLDARYSFRFFEQTLESFVEAVDIEQATLVVHDLGGPVGLYWAVRNPHRIAKLVILNTLVYPQTSWAVKAFVVAMRVPLLRDYIVSPRGIVAAMKLGVVHKERLGRETLTPYTKPFEDRASRKALIKAGSGLGFRGIAEIARKLPELGVPTRIIYGEDDRILPNMAKTARRLERDLDGVEVTSLPNCGHFLQEDDPIRVGELIAEFVR